MAESSLLDFSVAFLRFLELLDYCHGCSLYYSLGYYFFPCSEFSGGTLGYFSWAYSPCSLESETLFSGSIIINDFYSLL
jgi:hypothetical protein